MRKTRKDFETLEEYVAYISGFLDGMDKAQNLVNEILEKK